MMQIRGFLDVNFTNYVLRAYDLIAEISGGPIGLFVLFPKAPPWKPMQTSNNNNAPRCLLCGPQVHHRVRLQRRNRCFSSGIAGKRWRKRRFTFLLGQSYSTYIKRNEEIALLSILCILERKANVLVRFNETVVCVKWSYQQLGSRSSDFLMVSAKIKRRRILFCVWMGALFRYTYMWT